MTEILPVSRIAQCEVSTATSFWLQQRGTNGLVSDGI